MISTALIIIVFGGSIILGFTKQDDWTETNLSIYILYGLLLVLASTFRPPYMLDYPEYINEILSKGSGRMEPSFYIIRYICNIFHINPLGTLFVYSSLGTYLVLYSIRRDSNYHWFSLVLFVSIYFILGEMIQIRQAVATGLLLVGIKYIYNKNLMKYLLICGCAVLFHYSAIIMLPLYLLSSTHKSACFYMLLLMIIYAVGTYIQFGTIIDMIGIKALSDIYYVKTSSIDISTIQPINIRFIIQVILCIYFWIKIDIFSYYNKYAVIYLKIYTLGLCVYLLFQSIPDAALRLSFMLQISEIIIIPLIIKILKPEWISMTIVSMIAFKYLVSSLNSYLIHG